jgi:tetratricopeptide (TPR) repeat protein
MGRRRLTVVALLALVVALGGAGRGWQFLDQPFTLSALLQLASRHGFLMQPTDPIAKYASKSSISINEKWAGPTSYHARMYILDAQRIVNTWWFPRRLRRFVAQELYSSGVTFVCNRVMLLDGSISNRDPRSVASRVSGLDEQYLKPVPGKGADWLFLIFLHEQVHLVELHIDPKIAHALDSRFNAGNDLMKNGRFEAAAEQFKSIHGECPAYFQAIDHHAIAERRRDNPAEALRLYQLSLLVKPDNQIALQNMIPLLMESGRVEEARMQAATLTSLAPDNPEGPFWSSMIGFARSNAAEALRDLDRARDIYLRRRNPALLHADLLLIGYRLSNGDRDLTYQALLQYRRDCVSVSLDGSLAAWCALSGDEILASAAETYRTLIAKVRRNGDGEK